MCPCWVSMVADIKRRRLGVDIRHNVLVLCARHADIDMQYPQVVKRTPTTGAIGSVVYLALYTSVMDPSLKPIQGAQAYSATVDHLHMQVCATFLITKVHMHWQALQSLPASQALAGARCCGRSVSACIPHSQVPQSLRLDDANLLCHWMLGTML